MVMLLAKTQLCCCMVYNNVPHGQRSGFLDIQDMNEFHLDCMFQHGRVYRRKKMQHLQKWWQKCKFLVYSKLLHTICCNTGSTQTPVISFHNIDRSGHFTLYKIFNPAHDFICTGNYWGSSVWIWCNRSSTDQIFCICGNKMPTRCNRGFYCRSYCLLNMFRASLCPSSASCKPDA